MVLCLHCLLLKPFIMDDRIDAETLKPFVSNWPPQRWQEYEPLLSYCRDNGVRIVACGTPLKVLFFLSKTKG